MAKEQRERDPYTVTKGQWEGCPGDGESVGGPLRQMGGSCLTMPLIDCWSIPCCDVFDETEGRLEPRILFILELRRYGTLLLVIGIPPWNKIDGWRTELEKRKWKTWQSLTCSNDDDDDLQCGPGLRIAKLPSWQAAYLALLAIYTHIAHWKLGSNDPGPDIIIFFLQTKLLYYQKLLYALKQLASIWKIKESNESQNFFNSWKYRQTL